GQKQAAKDCIQQALHLDPKHAETHTTLGKLLLEEGRREEAERSLRKALRQDPYCANALAAVASSDVFPLSHDELDRIRRLLANPSLTANHASRLHFGLATLMDRAGAYEQAFGHFRHANALRRQFLGERGMGFDPEANRAVIDQF